jgi:myosin-5
MLKQFGGYSEFMKFNTDAQNQQQLKNFDLSEYRLVILDTIISSYIVLVRQIQEALKPYIVPAILDHDETARGKSNRTTKSLDISSPEGNRSISEPKALVQQLETIYNQLVNFGVDQCYIVQTIKQLMYYICAITLNNLMVRGDMCVWKTGMKMRYNISCLESWVRDKKLDTDVLNPLQPLIQVSSLLQSRKTEEDVGTVIELTTALSAAQVMKVNRTKNGLILMAYVLHLYSSSRAGYQIVHQ